MKPELPVTPSAIGISAKMVAAEVIRIGRRRFWAPAIRPSPRLMPWRRYWLTRSISTIALVTTTPTSISSPIIEGSPSGTCEITSRPKEPVAAKGIETSRISGWIRDLKIHTSST